MFAELLVGLRGLKRSLTIGYAFLLTGWLAARETDWWASLVADATVTELVDSVQGLGSTAVAGLISFGAALLGSLLSNTLAKPIEKVIDLVLANRGWKPPFEEYVVASRDNWPTGGPSGLPSSSLVEQLRRNSNRGADPMTQEGLASVELWREEYQERQRLREAYEYRRTLGWVTIAPAAVLSLENQWFLFALIALPTLLVVDGWQLSADVRAWHGRDLWERAMFKIQENNVAAARDGYVQVAYDHWPDGIEESGGLTPGALGSLLMGDESSFKSDFSDPEGS